MIDNMKFDDALAYANRKRFRGKIDMLKFMKIAEIHYHKKNFKLSKDIFVQIKSKVKEKSNFNLESTKYLIGYINFFISKIDGNSYSKNQQRECDLKLIPKYVSYMFWVPV
jgi:hypothetical protein